MLTPYDQQFLETVAIVLQDLQCFINQKNNQALIYALLQIKKTARKSRNRPQSIQRKSNTSQSHKNYSQRSSSLSVHSVGKSVSKQSQASFDIIKCAQIFNSTKKKGIQSKLYTQTYHPEPDYFSRDNQQPSTLSQPSQRNLDPITKVNTLVPKLEGLVSSEEISDIEQPSGRESRNNAKIAMRQYQNSIQQVDDEDDQFQDIVLNRLDLIEQKVNQMLRDKKHQRLSTLSSRVPQSHSYQLSKSKLNNVGSGPNILYSKNLNGKHDLYKYPESRYPNSTALMSPRVYTFHNSKNVSLHPSSKKMTNRSFKQNLTDRNDNIQRPVNHQNYFTDNQQYAGDDHPENSQLIHDQIYEIQDHSELMPKSKKLGQYCESSNTLHEEEAQQIHRPHQRVQTSLETTINYAKIKQQTLDDKAFKYIPLSKINHNRTQNIPQKTQRQTPRRNQESRQPNYQNVQHFANKNHTVIIEKGGKNYETSSQKHSQPHYQNNYPAQKIRNDDKYRSGRDSGIRQNHLNGSQVRAHTDHGDYTKNDQDLSVRSQKDIYTQIRQLREIAKLYGAQRQKKYQPKAKRPIPQGVDIEDMGSGQYDYRYHQKTQRQKYPSNRTQNQNQKHEYDEQEDVIIQGVYPEERFVKVVQKIPHYSHQVQSVHNNRVPQRTQYIQYQTREEMVYTQPYPNNSYNKPVYVVRQRQGPVYQQVQEVYEEPYYGGAIESELKTVIMKEDSGSNISHRKMSSGSLNSFKSIPYVRTEGNGSVHNEISFEYIVQRPVRYVQTPVYQDY